MICVLAFEVVWAPAAGIRMANDDLKFARSPSREMALVDAIADAWRTQPTFRPLEVTVAHLSDPVTLSCPWVAPVQGMGLVALLGGTLAIVRQALPELRLMWPIALLIVLLSPATTASVWQMDSCSQTWAAALGAWSVWLAWRWISRPEGAGAEPWVLMALCAAVAAGLTVKESFYGWSLGLTMSSAFALFGWFGRDRASAARRAWVLVPVAALPVLHFACRWHWSALRELLGSGGESRYEAEFGANVLLNSVVSLSGAMGSGPFHMLFDSEAPFAVRALPAVATGTVVVIIVVGAGLAAFGREPAAGVKWGVLVFAASASVLSLCATIPMASVSELYGCGPNVGCALLAVAGAAVLWRSGADLAILRAGVTSCLAAVMAIGAYGLFSRAHHFSVVWRSVQLLNDAIVVFQPTLPATRAGDAAPVGLVHIPTGCLLGTTYSQYVMPPAQALDLTLTEAWLARRDPSRPIAFSIGTSPRSPRPSELVLDCAALPQHGRW